MADGTLKVGEITNSAGSGNITIGSGVTVNVNRPAFHATVSATQAIAQDTTTLVQFNSEVFDTNGCYDTSTYLFTPTESGKYYIYSMVRYETSTDFQSNQMFIYKNSSSVCHVVSPNEHYSKLSAEAIVECNGTSDTVSIYVRQESGAGSLNLTSDSTQAFFYGYKLGA
jgi:hypothetical protein